MSQGIAEYLEKVTGFMAEPPRMSCTLIMDGRIYETDASKVLTIAPSKLEAAMANPELRKLIVIPLE